MLAIGLTLLLLGYFVSIKVSIKIADHSATMDTAIHEATVTETAENGSADNTDIIKAQDYEQFWIWTAPRDSQKLSQAHTLYILQGEIRPDNLPYYYSKADITATDLSPATLTPQGLGVRNLKGKKIWLVYRATSKNWSDEVMAQLINRLDSWQQAGNQVIGIQIDYDAPTYQLHKYAQLLTDIRQQLPSYYQLSVTGLLDWSNQSENPQFMQFNQIVDELVVQTYQGTETVPNYAQYLKRLQHLPYDFKVGIIEGSQWQGADFLEDNPHFKGYVVFLRR